MMPEYNIPKHTLSSLSDTQKKLMRRRIDVAIRSIGDEITIYRDVIYKDRYKGKHRRKTRVAAIHGLVERSSGSRFMNNINDPNGNVDTIKHMKLITIWRDDFTFNVGDYFYINNIKHEITYPLSIGGIYWDCGIEIVLRSKEDEVGKDGL